MIWKGLLYYIIIFKYLEHHIYVYLFKKNQHRVLDLTWHCIVWKYKTCPHSFDFSDSMCRWPLRRLYLPREYFRYPLPYSCEWDQPIQRQIILAHVYCFSSFSKVLARKKNFNVLKCKKTAMYYLYSSRITKNTFAYHQILINILATFWFMVLSIVLSTC